MSVAIEQFQESQSSHTSQYLTFILGSEEYGVEILKVQEIRGFGAVTKIPNTPDYVLGVINLRGAIIPIIDLRIRFALESVEYTPTTVIIVATVKLRDRTRTIGIVVDAVSEVYNIEDSCLQPSPDFGCNIDTAFVSHLANIEGKLIILMAIERLISNEVLTNIAETMPQENTDKAKSASQESERSK